VASCNLRLNSRDLAMRVSDGDAQDRELGQPSVTGGLPIVVVALSQAPNNGHEATLTTRIHAYSK
jgi:hypothetical protein